ncbi:MAG: hypothetical protein H6739_36295 [Alphaproteobacteria bacterium]|nr:hypothetical protein [Alphaproteobacteria bacterium]
MPEVSDSIIALLFRAWRARATGLYTVHTPDGDGKVYLQRGRVVQVEGVDGLLEKVGVSGAQDRGALVAGLGAAAASGVDIDLALAAAAEALGRWLARSLETPEVEAGFTEGVPAPPGSFPLPTPIGTLLLQGMREVRSSRAIAQALRPLRYHRVHIVDASISGELDPVALRTLKRCRGGPTVEDVIATSAAGGSARRAAAWRALDLLLQLGVVGLEAPEGAEAFEEPEAPEPEAAPPAPAGSGPSGPGGARPGPEDAAQAAELLDTAARLKELGPLDALGIPDDEPVAAITRDRVDSAFRSLAQAYHPDRFARRSAEVQEAAAEVFAVLNDHARSVSDPDALEIERQKHAARQRGEVWVSEVDQEKARVLFRKAEQLERSRSWVIARDVLAEAMQVDPMAIEPKILDVFLSAVVKERAPMEAIAALAELQPANDRQRGEIAYRLGRLLRLANDEKKARAAFRKCLEYNANHLPAQRELRLLERRHAAAGAKK